MSSKLRMTASLAVAMTAFSALAAAASPVFDCFLGYKNAGQGLQLTLHPADCYFTVQFQHPGDPFSGINRTLGCSIPANGGHCSVTFDPVSLGVPTGHVAVAAKAAPLTSSYGLPTGCAYSTLQRSSSTEIHSYPVTFFDTSSTLPTPTASNPLPYVWGGDPMPAQPLTYGLSDPMPALPVTGDSYHVVVLHYLDCAG